MREYSQYSPSLVRIFTFQIIHHYFSRKVYISSSRSYFLLSSSFSQLTLPFPHTSLISLLYISLYILLPLSSPYLLWDVKFSLIYFCRLQVSPVAVATPYLDHSLIRVVYSFTGFLRTSSSGFPFSISKIPWSLFYGEIETRVIHFNLYWGSVLAPICYRSLQTCRGIYSWFIRVGISAYTAYLYLMAHDFRHQKYPNWCLPWFLQYKDDKQTRLQSLHSLYIQRQRDIHEKRSFIEWKMRSGNLDLTDKKMRFTG